MRLTQKEIEFINKTIKNFLDCEIYLFGSRIDDNLKGGDIDLYIIPKEKNFNEFEIQMNIREILENELYLPVDLIFSKNKNRDIEKEALKGIKIGWKNFLCYNLAKLKGNIMNKLYYIWIGFKNAFNDIKKDYPVKELWDISHSIENKFQKVNNATSKKLSNRNFY